MYILNLQQQPKTLSIFFLTEMWERYGFYVIQTLLAIYLAFHFQWPDSKVYSLVGSFTALTYLSPFVGGWIADRFLGQKASVLLGAIILLLSYVVLGFGKTQFTLMHALASIAIGTGLLKPNIASLLGTQYTDQCAHREHGFTIFYLGITTGIILGTTLPSVLKHYFGWQIAFISAALGLLFSIISFVFGILRHHIDDYHPKKIQLNDMVCTIITLMILWPLCGHILIHPEFADIIFPLISILAICYLLYCIFNEPKAQSVKTLLILLLCSVSVIFWAFYFQMFMSLTLFIIRAVQSEWFHIHLAPPYYVALQSLGMIVLGILLTRKNQKILPIAEKAIDISKKFTWAMFYMLLAYGLLVTVCKISIPDCKISPLFIAMAYLCISVAELLLSPVGISAITVLSCRKKVSTMMGIFFVSLGVGGFLSGKLANLTAIEDTQAPLRVIKLLYTKGFINLTIILSLGFILTLMIHLFINKYISKRLILNNI
jgi:proton-dependent oligopeptide transporter, POT family